MRLVEGRRGAFVSFPARKVGEEWVDIIELSDGLRDRVRQALLAAPRDMTPDAATSWTVWCTEFLATFDPVAYRADRAAVGRGRKWAEVQRLLHRQGLTKTAIA